MTVRINRSLFGDKSTFILREMLRIPDRKWKVRDFAKKCRISVGLVSRTLSFLDKLGFVERVNQGRIGYTRLIKRGNAIASLMWSSLHIHVITRSTPRPKPEWGTEPYFLRSIYHS